MEIIYTTNSYNRPPKEAATEFANRYWDKPRKIRLFKVINKVTNRDLFKNAGSSFPVYQFLITSGASELDISTHMREELPTRRHKETIWNYFSSSC